MHVFFFPVWGTYKRRDCRPFYHHPRSAPSNGVRKHERTRARLTACWSETDAYKRQVGAGGGCVGGAEKEPRVGYIVEMPG